MESDTLLSFLESKKITIDEYKLGSQLPTDILEQIGSASTEEGIKILKVAIGSGNCK